MSWCQSHYKLRKISKWISNYAREIEPYSRNACQTVSHSHATKNMNAAVSKWHKLAHQFCEIDFIQKVLMDVADSNTVQKHLGHGRSRGVVTALKPVRAEQVRRPEWKQNWTVRHCGSVLPICLSLRPVGSIHISCLAAREQTSAAQIAKASPLIV